MKHHVVLVVNTFVTPKDPRRGAQFRLHLQEYARRDWRTGLIAVDQRDYGFVDCLRNGGFVFEGAESGAPILRNAVQRQLPRAVRGRHVRPALARRTFKRYVRDHGMPDLIHAHGSQWAGHAALTLKRHYGVPYVLTEHMSNLPRGLVADTDLPLVKEIFANAAIALPVSRPLGETLERLFGDAVRPWRVVPNMLDDGLFAYRPSDIECDAERAAGAVFFTAVRLDPIKDLDILIKAFHRAGLGPDARLRIAGAGPERDKLIGLAGDLGISSRIDFLGALSRQGVRDEMRRASAYVLSSRYETFGIPVIEALASGLPVVATRCDGVSDLVDESNGIPVPVGDADALAAALRRMSGEHGRYDRAAIGARCKAGFSPDAVLDRLAAVYDEAVAGSRRDGERASPSLPVRL